MFREMMILFKQLRRISESAKSLFDSIKGEDAVRHEAQLAGLPREAICFVTVGGDRVRQHIAVAHLSIVFHRQTPANAGGSPTKLAELFALNVPVIANTGVGELNSIVDLDRNASPIGSLYRSKTLRSALERVLARGGAGRLSTRERSTEFPLNEGVRRYHHVYHDPASSAVLQPDRTKLVACTC
jgi:hypothetical protein